MNEKQIELKQAYYKLLLSMDDRRSSASADDLSEALRLIVGITDADLGYVELRGPNGKTWWSGRHWGRDDIEGVRERISKGIIARAIDTGETIATPSAMLDNRLKDLDGVKSGNLDAVICSPIQDREIDGVIYLHKKGGNYRKSGDDITDARLFSKHITPLLHGLKRKLSPREAPLKLDGFIGKSEAFQNILMEIKSVTQNDAPVLVRGETGVGKTHLAGLIHENSARRGNPFIHINCANLQEHLVESELFGSVKGSHSGAYKDLKGKIAAAAGGTLFLDEIGELPMALQPKLLQFMDEGFYFPLGADVPEKADVRIITASNIDFEEAIGKKTFRSDLYYRISVYPITAPPLRERKEDIPGLFQYFVNKYCNQFNITRFTAPQSVLDALQAKNWPGNIRQLENVVQRAVLRASCEYSDALEIRHVFNERKAAPVNNEKEGELFRSERTAWEKRYLAARLEENAWNISKTAQILGLSRGHMSRLLKRHNLRRENSLPN